jgi:hypothetical protein
LVIVHEQFRQARFGEQHKPAAIAVPKYPPSGVSESGVRSGFYSPPPRECAHFVRFVSK